MLTIILHKPTEKHYRRIAQSNRLWILGSISVLDRSRTIILVIEDCVFSQCWSYIWFQWILDHCPSSFEVGNQNNQYFWRPKIFSLQETCQILARKMHILQESCKKNVYLARILHKCSARWRSFTLKVIKSKRGGSGVMKVLKTGAFKNNVFAPDRK